MNFSFSRLFIPFVLMIALIGGALTARYTALGGSLLDGLELRLLDARFVIRGPKSQRQMEAIKQQIAVVAMDDQTYERFGVPLPRGVHARMIEHLRRAGARAVLFDVLFLDPSKRSKNEDADFARALRQTHIGYLPFDDSSAHPAAAPLQRELERRAALDPSASSTQHAPFRPPTLPLFQAARGLGHVSSKSDSDGRFRRSVLLLEENGLVYPHVALAAVANVWGVPLSSMKMRADFLEVGSHRIGPLQRATTTSLGHKRQEWLLPLDFAGGRDTMNSLTLSYSDVLDGKNDARLRGRIVIIGESATGTPDLRPSPFDQNANFIGVHTNATLLANLLQNDSLIPAPFGLNASFAVVCGIFAGLLALGLRPLWSFLSVGVLAVLTLVFSQLLFVSGNTILDTVSPLLCIALCYVGMAGFRSTTWEREGRASAQSLLETQLLLGQIVNPRLAHELANDPQKRLDLQIGTRREVSVLFCDIRGFTPWCEGQTPEQVKSRLDDYFPLMCEICEDDFDGFIDKFIGDAIMVVWNAHRDHPDHAQRAVRAGLAMQRGLALLNDGWKKQGLEPFHVGVGVATGEAIWGTFGAPNRKVAPTVLGDTVNLASRLEGLSKDVGPVVVSQSTAQLLGETFRVRFAGELPIKGKGELQNVYCVDAESVAP